MKRGFVKFSKNTKRGQVWVETVIYTLIAFVVLGGVLAFAKPKIEELQDESAIQDSIKMLEKMDKKINEISPTTGNKRKLGLSVRKGSFLIDSKNNSLKFNIETSYQYSEPGRTVNQGDIKIMNTQVGEKYRLNATLDYENYNLTWSGENKKELLSSSPTEYQIFVSNEGTHNSKKKINFESA